MSEQSIQSSQQEGFPYAKVNFVVNPHNIHAKYKNTINTGGANIEFDGKNLKLKLTPKPINRDFTPPLLRPDDSHSKKLKISPNALIEAQSKGKITVKPEKLISPRKQEPVLEQIQAPLNVNYNVNVISGHFTPCQEYNIGQINIANNGFKGPDSRSASATRKFDGKQNSGGVAKIVAGTKTVVTKNLHAHPRNYIAKHPTTTTNNSNSGKQITVGVKNIKRP